MTTEAGSPLSSAITVPHYAAKGTWSVSWAQVTDKASNSHAYSRDDPALAGSSFTADSRERRRLSAPRAIGDRGATVVVVGGLPLAVTRGPGEVRFA